VIKYPSTWTLSGGVPGRPYSVTGTAGNNKVLLTTRVLLNTQVKTEDEVKAWLQANIPKATLMQLKIDTVNGSNGFTVSYNDPDPDGNQRSSVTMLLNSPDNRLFVVTEQWAGRGVDMLDTTNVNVPPELAQVRGSFFAVPQNVLVATVTPAPTLTPLATVTPD